MNKNPSYWKEVHGAKKVGYLLDYYRLPLILIGIVVWIVIWCFGRSAEKKDYGLYVGMVNFVPPEVVENVLEKESFEPGGDIPEKPVCLYRNLFITTDPNSEYHPYTYASRMKILGAIEAEQMDVVLMDKEAFDSFSQNGYLADLSMLLADQADAGSLQPMLTENIRIEEDNSTDMLLGNADRYEAVTTEAPFGLNLSMGSALIREAALNGTVYLGIIENSPRKEEAVRYLQNLTA